MAATSMPGEAAELTPNKIGSGLVDNSELSRRSVQSNRDNAEPPSFRTSRVSAVSWHDEVPAARCPIRA